MNEEISVDDLIKKIDGRLAELNNNNNYVPNEKIIDEITQRMDNLEENIDVIYDKYMNKLNSLVGLDEVKEEVKKMINYLIFVKKTENSLKLDNLNLNMVFKGNPGTGKTTVAKIVAEMFYKLGFVKSNKVIETTPRDFIAGYIGQTAIKARKTIDSAKNGVIFIDEAHTFAQSIDEEGHTFVYEALTEIIKEMEKKETVFIFSGYKSEMDNFIKLNPGIKSRIGYDINFKDYTKNELLLMFCKKVKKSGLKLSKNTKNILMEKIEASMTKKNFGNGRMIDNLFNDIIKEHATNNLYEKDKDKLLLITEDSIKNINVIAERGMCFE